MKRYLTTLFLASFLGLSLGLSAPSSARAEEEVFLLGTARKEITPPVGTPLSGFARRRGKPSKGVLDPLYARALTLTKGEKSVTFVSIDIVLIERYFREVVIKKAQKEVPLDGNSVILFPTHTHSGSGALGKQFWQRFIAGRFNRKRFEETTDRVAKAIVEATRNQIPVSAEGGKVDAGDLVENRMDKRLAYPAPLKMLRFRGKNGKIAGEIVFFAAHPTILPAKNFRFSADFPGALTRLLEEESEGSVALFVNGAVGDLRPHGSEAETPEARVVRYGEALFKRTQSIEFRPVSLEGEWRIQTELIQLPSVKLRAGFLRFPYFIGNRVFPRRTLFQMIQMGNLLFIALPAELASETGYAIEERARGYGFTPFLAGIANDYVGYVIPERYYLDRSQYEARASFYGRKFDFFLHQNVDRMMGEFLDPKPRRYFARKPGVLTRDYPVPVLYLRGNAYETGYEHGRLLREEIRKESGRIYRYLNRYLNRRFVIPGLSHILVKQTLLRTWKKMEPYVSYDELMEMQGLADGSGLSLGEVKRFHAIPDLIETFCSNGVYFGPATEGGRLIHVRNLDWVREMGVHRLAALIVYEPDWGNRYVNIGYYGFIGSLTGVNEKGISVGQIGADSVDETLRGTPMPFLLKRVLHQADTLEEAVKIITDAFRTSATNYVFADAREKKTVAIETTAHHSQVFVDDDPKESGVSYALPLKDALVRADTAMDPVIRNLQTASKGDPEKEGLEPPDGSSAYDTRYKKHTELVRRHFGELDQETAREIAQSIAPDSNLQSVVFQFPDFWVANATEELPAAKTTYHPFNYEELAERLKSLVEKPEGGELKVGEE